MSGWGLAKGKCNICAVICTFQEKEGLREYVASREEQEHIQVVDLSNFDKIDFDDIFPSKENILVSLVQGWIETAKMEGYIL